MKLLCLSIAFLGVGLMHGAVKPMKNELTPVSGVGYAAVELTDLGLAIKGKSLLAINQILEKNQNCVHQEVKVGSRMFPLEYAFFLHGGDEVFMEQIVAMFCKAGVDVNIYENFSALHYAAGYGYLKLFKQLLDFGADVTALTSDHASVVHCAVGMYQDMKPKDIEANQRRLSLSQGSPSESKKRRASLQSRVSEDPDLNGGLSFQLAQISLSQKQKALLNNRLEILKMLLIDNNIAYRKDQNEIASQTYAIHEKLEQLLDGLSDNVEANLALYELIKSELAEECLSPRTPRTPGRSRLGSSSISLFEL